MINTMGFAREYWKLSFGLSFDSQHKKEGMAVIPKNCSKRKSKPLSIIDCGRLRDFKAGCDPEWWSCVLIQSAVRGEARRWLWEAL